MPTMSPRRGNPHHILNYCDAIARTKMMIFGNKILHHNTEGYTLRWNGGQLKTFIQLSRVSSLFMDADKEEPTEDAPPSP